MRIVVLDGHTVNPGDLNWENLQALGSCHIHERTPDELAASRAQKADIVLTNKTALPAPVIADLPQLKYISVLATGYNMVDVEAARQRDIPVSNVPAYGTDSVAQMVFAHLLNLTQHVAEHARTVRTGRWSESPDFCYWDFPLVELAGLTLGIVGLGRIGQATARIAGALGMEVIYYDVRQDVAQDAKARAVDLDTVFRESDVVSLHCPLTEENRGLVNERRLNLMKPGAFLINTSRGPLVDERALAEALHSGRIAGAGLDVLSNEPPDTDNPLPNARNCYVTPHIAWATRAARERLLQTTVKNVVAFLEGKPQNVVNGVKLDAPS